ncbi:MAG: hypothetical protein JW940_07065 [Polyangiaceae bacterium]|nr:hypothetical protein [Polyangiaceae bacterium]
MRRHGLLGLLLVGAAAAATGPARAQSAADKETARTHMDNADARFHAKDFAEALRLYQAADDIMHVPTTGLEVARTLAEMNRLVEAYDRALVVTRLPSAPREPAPFVEARKRAQALADELARRIPSMVVKVQGVAPDAAVQVQVDGAPIAQSAALLPLKLDPGKHQIVVTAPGYERVELERDIPEGQLTEIVAELRPAPPPQAEPARLPAPVQAQPARPAPPVSAPAQATPEAEPEIPMLAYVGIGVGALGVGVGAVTGTWSWAKTASLRDEDCGGGNSCSPESKSERATANTLANISNVAFGVGLVGAGLGVYALVAARSEQPPSSTNAGELRFDVARGQAVRLRPELGPNGVWLSGRF